jgi:hypothetical protein
MSTKNLGGQLVAFFSSLRLAVVTMVTLGGIAAFATFYEMEHGTPAVQRDIYQTPWFAFLLGLLGVNVLLVMVSRWPWTKHQIGFLVAHVGILFVLGGSVVSLYGGLDSNMVLAEGETSDRVRLLQRALRVSIPGLGAHATFPVFLEERPPTPDRERRFPIPNSDVVLVADGYEPHATVSESFEPAETGLPALHFVLEAPMATQEAWLVPDDPRRSHLDLGMVSFGFHAARSEEQVQQLLQHAGAANHLSFVLAPDGTIEFGAAGSSGPLRTGVIELGQPVDTGWPGLGVTVDRFHPRAVARRAVAPAPLPKKEEQRSAAVHLRLESPSGATEPEWLLWGDLRSVRLGDQTASLAYRPPEAALPFRVTLLRFNNESYPGSRMASTYESTVRIEDPDEGTFETLISMNHPLHHRGYIFFQSSFVEGRPMISIFSVARAPGLPFVYLGTALIGIGVAWMFYGKPWLARRQAARALEARRAQESRDDSKPAGPISAGA